MQKITPFLWFDANAEEAMNFPTLLPKLLSDKDPRKSQGVMKAMLQMRKIESKQLQQAYDQA